MNLLVNSRRDIRAVPDIIDVDVAVGPMAVAIFVKPVHEAPVAFVNVLSAHGDDVAFFNRYSGSDVDVVDALYFYAAIKAHNPFLMPIAA